MSDADMPDAAWISLDAWQRDADPIQPRPIAFRYDFSLAEGQADGWLEVTASHAYVLWINGRLALRGPTRSFPADRLIDRLMLDGWLRAGVNSLAVVLMPPTGVLGYSCPTRSGFFCRGRVEGPTPVFLKSDGGWFASEVPWMTSHRLLLSLAAGAQEHWDLAVWDEDWLTKTPVNWNNARVQGGAGTPPWRRMRPNPIQRLRSVEIRPELVWSGRDDRSVQDPGKNLAWSFPNETLRVDGYAGTEDGVISTAQSNVFVWDLGKTRFFQPGFEVLKVHGDVQMEWYYDIKLEDVPSAMRGFGTEREGLCDSVKVSKGPTKWQSLQGRGGRFVTLRVSGDAVCELWPRISLLEYPFPHPARFESEEAWLEDVWRAASESLRSCATDAIVDTCARENNLWTFDACVGGKAMYHTFGDAALWRHGLWLIGEGISQEGDPLAVVPAQASFMCLFDQTFQWLISVEEYTRETGDRTLLDEVAEPILRFLKRCEALITGDDLFVPPSYSWHWVDWAPLDRRAYSLPINAAFVRGCRAILSVSVSSSISSLLHDILRRVEPALEGFWNEGAGLYRDHVAPKNWSGLENRFLSTPPDEALTSSLHGNLQMASLLGPDDARRQRVVQSALPWLTDEGTRQMAVGPGWIQQILAPLIESGAVEESLGFLRRTYGPQLATGSRTLAEGFSPRAHNSAHAWGASVNSLIVEDLLGVKAQGEMCVVFEPRLRGDFYYERETSSGSLGVRRVGDHIFLKIPLSMTARYKGRSLVGNGEWCEV